MLDGMHVSVTPLEQMSQPCNIVFIFSFVLPILSEHSYIYVCVKLWHVFSII